MSLVIALDPPEGVDGVKWSINLIGEVGHLVKSFKIGMSLGLRTGIKDLRDVVSVMPKGSFSIADFKLADIGYVMSSAAHAVSEAGFKGVIAHSFVGREGALGELSKVCRDLGIKLILVGFMSHPGSNEVMRKVKGELYGVINDVRPWGAVFPATMPEIINEGRKKLSKDIKILSPGVGAQGASPGDALCAGANYEIVGRLITRSPNPKKATESVLNSQTRRLKECRGSLRNY